MGLTLLLNPPYNGNLHLKILEEALNHSDNIVNLSPVRWLQDPLAKYKKGSDFLKFADLHKHIESLEMISGKEAQRLFQSKQYENLGLYKLSSKKVDNLVSLVDLDTLFFIEKVSLPVYNKKYESIYKYRTPEGKANFSTPFVRLTAMHGNLGSNDYVEITSKNKKLCMTKPEKLSNVEATINFKTQAEAENFYDSLQTSFMKFANKCIKTNMRVPYYGLPFMGNVVNPRTGLKGYEGEWTDEDFYKFFNLTEDEIKIIKNTMKEYK